MIDGGPGYLEQLCWCGHKLGEHYPSHCLEGCKCGGSEPTRLPEGKRGFSPVTYTIYEAHGHPVAVANIESGSGCLLCDMIATVGPHDESCSRLEDDALGEAIISAAMDWYNARLYRIATQGSSVWMESEGRWLEAERALIRATMAVVLRRAHAAFEKGDPSP